MNILNYSLYLQLTGVRISCCVITPTFGLEQLLWRRELDIAQTAHLALNPGTDWMKIDQMIQNWSELAGKQKTSVWFVVTSCIVIVKNLNFATYLKFATGENTNKINELW